MAEAWRVHRIKTTVPVFDVLRELGVPVEYTGTHQIRCPSPQHTDRRPSARVYAEDHRVHCFRCAKSWDVLDLVQLIAGLHSLDEAVQWCEQHFAIPDAAQAAPEIVIGAITAKAHPDLSQLATEVESAIRQQHFRTAFPLEVYTNIWIAFDIAAGQHHSGELSDEAYREFLLTLKHRAFGLILRRSHAPEADAVVHPAPRADV